MEDIGRKSKESTSTECSESGGEELTPDTGVSLHVSEDAGIVSPDSPSSLTTSSTAVQATKQNSGPCYVKCLINDAIAGSLIGRKGSVINSIKQDTGCFMRLSAPRSFFPNSQWRIVVASGTQAEVDKAVATIVDKTRDRVAALQPHESSPSRAPQNLQCRIVAPKSAISAIIGTGGQSVKELQQRTKTRIQISAREQGSHERVITVSGHQDDLTKAAAEIVAGMQNDSNLKEIMNVVYKSTLASFSNTNYFSGPTNFSDGGYSYNSFPGSPISPYSNSGTGRMFPAPPTPYYGADYPNHTEGQAGPMMNGYVQEPFPFPPYNVNPSIPCEIRMKIPDYCVRLVIGRRRVGLIEVQNATGARVEVLRNSTENAAEHDCSVSGRVASVHFAHKMLLQRIEYFSHHG